MKLGIGTRATRFVNRGAQLIRFRRIAISIKNARLTAQHALYLLGALPNAFEDLFHGFAVI
jgi:hypothetical protein